MSSLRFFLLPGEFFALVSEVAAKRQLVPVLEHFPGGGGVRQWQIAEAGEELEKLYGKAGAGVLYLSLDATPAHPEDLGFTDKVEDQLLEFSGGRRDGDRLELATLRVFSKKSAAKPLFNAIKRKISALASQGGCAAQLEDGREVAYRDIFCSPAARQLDLCLKLNTPPSIRFECRD